MFESSAVTHVYMHSIGLYRAPVINNNIDQAKKQQPFIWSTTFRKKRYSYAMDITLQLVSRRQRVY